MECPACDNLLQKETHHKIELDACRVCGGVWFDNFEVKKFDEAHEEASSLLELSFDKSVQVDDSRDRKCPKCSDIVLRRHFFGPSKQIEIDDCASCGGVWLDQGELKQIRETYPTEEGRKAAAIKLFNEVAKPVLEKDYASDKERNQQMMKFARVLRFVCPSFLLDKYYKN